MSFLDRLFRRRRGGAASGGSSRTNPRIPLNPQTSGPLNGQVPDLSDQVKAEGADAGKAAADAADQQAQATGEQVADTVADVDVSESSGDSGGADSGGGDSGGGDSGGGDSGGGGGE